MAGRDSSKPDLRTALDRLWARFLPEMRQRAAVLEAAAAALAEGSLTLARRQDAGSAAHKLAGVLGTFNLARGTDVARELEILYSGAENPDPASARRLSGELRSMIENRK